MEETTKVMLVWQKKGHNRILIGVIPPEDEEYVRRDAQGEGEICTQLIDLGDYDPKGLFNESEVE